MSDALTIDLVRRAQAGDREALERLLSRYYDRVRRVVGIRMGPRVRSWTDSVDSMTRTFLKALEKFDTFEMRNESSLLRWLVTIAEGMIRDAADERNARKRSPDRERSIDLESPTGVPTFAPLPDPATTITSRLVRDEDRELVDRAIHELDAADRELLVQFYYLDATFEEIAEATGLVSARDEPARRLQAADAIRKRTAAARTRLAVRLQALRGKNGGASPI